MTVRNILYGPTIERLKNEYEVTIISNYEKSLRGVLHDPNNDIKYEKLRIPRWQLPVFQGWLARWIYEWNYFALWFKKKPRTASIIMQWEKENRPIRFVFNTIGARVVSTLRRGEKERDMLRSTAYFLSLGKRFLEFNAVLASTTDTPKDQMLTYVCRKARIPIVCLVHSWDNLPGRGLLAAIPDRLLVWNCYMAEEAVSLHGVPRERIDIVGVPQYEHYRRIAKTTNQNTFRSRFEIPDGAKVITFTAGVEWVYPDEPELLERLLAEVTNSRFGNAVLIVRLHPTDDRTLSYIERYGNTDLPIRLDKADSAFAAMNTGKVGSIESVNKFVELMQFSDVVLNVASTISLDAILFDTPVICPYFSFTVPKDAWNSTEKLYHTSHFPRVVNSGAISLPNSVNEMLDDINTAIKYPEERQSERDLLSSTMMPDLPTSQLIHQSIQLAIEEKQSGALSDTH